MIGAMATKAISYLIALLILTSSLFIILSMISGLTGHDESGLRRSWKDMRKVDKHFFFDLLPSFDLNFEIKDHYIPSQSLEPTVFSNIMDRVLFSRYLVDRFAYSSFVQFGCSRRHVYQLLPDSTKTKACFDEYEGTVRISPFIYANSSTTKKKFDFIMLEPYNITLDFVKLSLDMLNPGGVLMIVDTNWISIKSNDTATFPAEHKALSTFNILLYLRSQHNLDVATLDVDGGLSVVFQRSNSGPLDFDQMVEFLTGEGLDHSNTNGIYGNNKGVKQQQQQLLANNSYHITDFLNRNILNLMNFEDIHQWLAPTGNVDAVTAFGGDNAMTTFKVIIDKAIITFKIRP